MSFIRKGIDIFMDGEYHIVYRQLNQENESLIHQIATQGKIAHRPKYSQLRPTWTEWYADPIPYKDTAGVNYVFMEVYDRFKDRGYIGVSAFDERGRLKRPRKVIEEPFHLSFPSLFTYQGKQYMIPECIAGGPVRIYVMGASVHEWKQCQVLEEITGCVDSVVYHDETTNQLILLTGEENADNKLQTRLRMFRLELNHGSSIQNVKETEAMTETAAFCSQDRSGILDSQEFLYNTRNGGPLLAERGQLYRVVQKSTDRIYGESLELYRIHTISENGYEEEQAGTISLADIQVSTLPLTTHRVGTHTYGKTENVEVLDLFVARFSLRNMVRKLMKRLQ